MPPPPNFNPDPPPPNFNDAAYRALVEKEAIRLAELTAAITIIARYAPGPLGKIAGLAAIAALGNPGENKKGNIGGAKTNPLPAPVGFAEPKVYGLKPNYYLPAGSSKVIPQPADLLGLGFKEQRFEDNSKEAFEMRHGQRVLAGNMLGKTDAELAKLINTQTSFGTAFENTILGRKDKKLEALKVAARNEQIFRSFPVIRDFVNQAGFIPLEVIQPNSFVDLFGTFPDTKMGSLQPEKIRPVNSKAIENEERAEGIRRELVTERADP
jgi:hypothetical protein